MLVSAIRHICVAEKHNFGLSLASRIRCRSMATGSASASGESAANGSMLTVTDHGDCRNTVFHSVNEIEQILQQSDKNGDADVEKLNALKQLCRELAPLDGSTVAHKPHPLIVVEGLDGSGKSTLVRNLAAALGGVAIGTPPPQLSELRKAFDGQPPALRRAFYSAANYVAARQVLDECQQRPVIMDRFWHSTAAYALASAGAVLPPVGDPVYRWPHDLLRPDAVLMLCVSERTRMERLSGRLRRTEGRMTREEDAMSRDAGLRRRIMEAFRRMESPAVREVDANRSLKHTLSAAQQALRKRSD